MDNLDMQILSRLLNNCRESDRQIGKNLGVSGSTIKSRIKKMQRTGVIEHFELKIEPPVLGYGVFYIVVTGRDFDAISKQVKLVGEPFLIVPCVGGITVCGIVVKEDVQQKIELAKNLMRDVRVLSIFEAENARSNPSLTKTDLVIITELIREPRQKIESMAKTMGLSPKTIARSIEKLQNDESVQFTLVCEPTKIDGYIPYTVLAWIDGDLSETLNRLKDKFAEIFLQTPFIAKNQVVLFMYSDNIFKLDEITQKIRDMSGVNSADLFIPKKIVFPQKWIQDSIRDASKSTKLHLMYQTN